MTLTVLIVDDEMLARARLRTLLKDCRTPAAHVAAEAANAAQAVDWLLHHPVDVALLDIHMPGPDGLALAQTLRALPRPPAVRVWARPCAPCPGHRRSCLSPRIPNMPCRPLNWRLWTT